MSNRRDFTARFKKPKKQSNESPTSTEQGESKKSTEEKIEKEKDDSAKQVTEEQIKPAKEEKIEKNKTTEEVVNTSSDQLTNNNSEVETISQNKKSNDDSSNDSKVETNVSGNLDNQKRTEEEKNKDSEDVYLDQNENAEKEIAATTIEENTEGTNNEKIVSLSNEEIKKMNEQLNLVLKHLKIQDEEQTEQPSSNLVRRSFDLPKKVAKRLKLESALTNKFMNDIVLEALENWFKEKGKMPEQLLNLLGDDDE